MLATWAWRRHVAGGCPGIRLLSGKDRGLTRGGPPVAPGLVVLEPDDLHAGARRLVGATQAPVRRCAGAGAARIGRSRSIAGRAGAESGRRPGEGIAGRAGAETGRRPGEGIAG